MNLIHDASQTDLESFLKGKRHPNTFDEEATPYVGVLDVLEAIGVARSPVRKRQVALSGYQYHRIRGVMEAYFPWLFTPRKTPPVPLKIGIGTDLMDFDIPVSPEQRNLFLASWTGRAEYHRVMLPGASRLDLDGGPVGVVTEEQAKWHLGRLQAKEQRKKALGRKAIAAMDIESETSEGDKVVVFAF